MPYQQSSDSCTVANRTVQTHAIPTVIRQLYSGKQNSPNTCHTNSHQTVVQWQTEQSKHMPYQQSSDRCTVANRAVQTHAILIVIRQLYSGKPNIFNTCRNLPTLIRQVVQQQVKHSQHTDVQSPTQFVFAFGNCQKAAE